MTVSVQQMHEAIDVAVDLVADDLYDLPHTPAETVDQMATQLLASLVAFHIEHAANPAEFLERLRQGHHDIVEAETQPGPQS